MSASAQPAMKEFAVRRVEEDGTSEVRLRGASFADALARHAAENGGRVERLIVGGVDLGGRALPFVFDNCEFAEVTGSPNFAGATFLRTGVSLSDLSGPSLDGAVFRDSQLDGTKLRGARARTVVFESCSLSGADLEGAVFGSVEMIGCDLSGASLRGLRADEMALSGCDCDGSAWAGSDIQFAAGRCGKNTAFGADFRGARLSARRNRALAAALGLWGRDTFALSPDTRLPPLPGPWAYAHPRAADLLRALSWAAVAGAVFYNAASLFDR